jgi:hypothetical protein
MYMRSLCLILFLGVPGVLLAGCKSTIVDPPPTTRPWTGPTQTMAQVVQEINANNLKLPTLWAKHYFEATIVDDKRQGHFVNGDGAILYRSPQAARGQGMQVVGNKPAFGQIFEIGSTEERYWLKVASPDLDTMWYGSYRHLGKPCVQKVPIQPALVAEVLGIGVFGTNFTEFPAPVMRFNPDEHVYTFVWVVPQANPSRLAAQKEIWYERATKRPTKVILFDENGRVQLRANLSGHQQVDVQEENLPAERRPWVATQYRLYFPENGSKMSFDLSDVRLNKGDVPTRRGIVFPGEKPEDAGVSKVIQLDKDCVD